MGSSVVTVTKLRLGLFGVRFPSGARDYYNFFLFIFFFTKGPDQFWSPPSILFINIGGYFFGIRGRGVTLTMTPSSAEVENECSYISYYE